MLVIKLVLIQVVWFFCMSVNASEQAINIEVQLTANKTNGVVSVEFINHSSHSIAFPKWVVLSEGRLVGDDFEIKRSRFFGGAKKYIGSTIKMPEPSKKDFVILSSGENFEAQVDLQKYYSVSRGKMYVRYKSYIPIYAYDGNAGEYNVIDFADIKSNWLPVIF